MISDYTTTHVLYRYSGETMKFNSNFRVSEYEILFYFILSGKEYVDMYIIFLPPFDESNHHQFNPAQVSYLHQRDFSNFFSVFDLFYSRVGNCWHIQEPLFYSREENFAVFLWETFLFTRRKFAVFRMLESLPPGAHSFMIVIPYCTAHYNPPLV